LPFGQYGSFEAYAKSLQSKDNKQTSDWWGTYLLQPGEQFLKGMDDAANDRINGWGTFFKDAWKSLTCQSDKYPNFIFFVMDALNQWITSIIFLPQTVWDLLRGLFSFDPYTVGYSLGTTFFMIFKILLAKAIAEGLTALAEKLSLIEKKIDGAGSDACFVAGTLVSTEFGKVAIENVRTGDAVWAWNPKTGEKALKSVTQTFVNESDKLIHVFVGGKEIVSTAEHPFYVKSQGWTEAKQLCTGDILVLQDGSRIPIEKVQYEMLASPVTVYNFEVADFHTYFVGENAVLVHNICVPEWFKKQFTELSAELHNQWIKGSFDTLEESLYYHYKTHGAEVGAADLAQYMRKAEEFSRTAKKGSVKSKVSGAVSGVIRYKKNGKYIDLAPDGGIVSFGKS